MVRELSFLGFFALDHAFVRGYASEDALVLMPEAPCCSGRNLPRSHGCRMIDDAGPFLRHACLHLSAAFERTRCRFVGFLAVGHAFLENALVMHPTVVPQRVCEYGVLVLMRCQPSCCGPNLPRSRGYRRIDDARPLLRARVSAFA